jgi:hypothetical protein
MLSVINRNSLKTIRGDNSNSLKKTIRGDNSVPLTGITASVFPSRIHYNCSKYRDLFSAV